MEIKHQDSERKFNSCCCQNSVLFIQKSFFKEIFKRKILKLLEKTEKKFSGFCENSKCTFPKVHRGENFKICFVRLWAKQILIKSVTTPFYLFVRSFWSKVYKKTWTGSVKISVFDVNAALKMSTPRNMWFRLIFHTVRGNLLVTLVETVFCMSSATLRPDFVIKNMDLSNCERKNSGCCGPKIQIWVFVEKFCGEIFIKKWTESEKKIG